MDETAISRTPVEIWRQILHLAVKWSLFPFEDDPDIRKIAFFKRDCALYHQYIEVVSTRGKLRRVCRSWATVMDESVDNLVIIGRRRHEAQSWPSSELIPFASCIMQVWLNGFCYHRGELHGRDETLLVPSTQFILHQLQRLAHTRLQEKSIAAEALLLGDLGTAHATHFVRSATGLKVLDLNYDLGRGVISIQDITVRHGLTHLRITMLRAHDVRDIIDLPYLTHLEIGLFEQSWDSSSKYFVSSWKIPMLEILMIKGSATQTTEDDINRFLVASPPKLHVIVFTFDEWLPPLNILTLLPNLTLLGVELSWFGREEAIQLYSEMKRSCKRLPNILISDFSAVPTDWQPFSVAHAINIVCWWKFQSGSVDYIAMDKSWGQLASAARRFWRANLRSDESSGRLVIKSFFEELLKEDVRFCDLNGNMLGGSESHEFMLGVERAGFQVPSSLQ